MTVCAKYFDKCPITFLAVYSKTTLPDEIMASRDKYEIFWGSTEESIETVDEDVPIIV